MSNTELAASSEILDGKRAIKDHLIVTTVAAFTTPFVTDHAERENRSLDLIQSDQNLCPQSQQWK